MLSVNQTPANSQILRTTSTMVTPNEELSNPLEILNYVILYLTELIHGAEEVLRASNHVM